MENFAANLGLDLSRWQQIQDLFAKIIGANVTFFSPSGTYLTHPSRVTSDCSDLAHPCTSKSAHEIDCISKAFQNTIFQKQHSFRCPHHLHFFSVQLRSVHGEWGGVVVGPVLVGKREEESAYRALCKEMDIDADLFCDKIREIRVFSFNGIHVVLDFLREMVEYLLCLSDRSRQLGELIPGFPAELRNSEPLFSTLKLNHMANYLLDIALFLSKGDSGSVLFLSEDSESFAVKTARGIRPEVLEHSRVPLRGSVTGWVVANNQSVLIDHQVEDETLRSQLKRPDIKSSMVVPIVFCEKLLGALCVNAISENERFNSENLMVLDKLGKLAGAIALSPITPPETPQSPKFGG